MSFSKCIFSVMCIVVSGIISTSGLRLRAIESVNLPCSEMFSIKGI